jgi:adenosine deaminase
VPQGVRDEFRRQSRLGGHALCTDNPAVSDTRLNREYEIATI